MVIHSLTFSSLELRRESEEPLVLDVQLGVELGEDEDLRAPVLGVRRALLQPQQGEAGSGQGQTAKAVSPLLLSSEKGQSFVLFHSCPISAEEIEAIIVIVV